jgi:hypothetical protein
MEHLPADQEPYWAELQVEALTLEPSLRDSSFQVREVQNFVDFAETNHPDWQVLDNWK